VLMPKFQDGWYLFRESQRRFRRATRVDDDVATGPWLADLYPIDTVPDEFWGPLPENHELLVEARRDGMGCLVRSGQEATGELVLVRSMSQADQAR
jgi:hypothetical protein